MPIISEPHRSDPAALCSLKMMCSEALELAVNELITEPIASDQKWQSRHSAELQQDNGSVWLLRWKANTAVRAVSQHGRESIEFHGRCTGIGRGIGSEVSLVARLSLICNGQPLANHNGSNGQLVGQPN